PAKARPMGIRPEERVCLDARRHGVALFRPLARALALAAAGIVCLGLSWPVPVAGAAALSLAAVLALVAVVRWDRTRLVVTTEKVFLVHGDGTLQVGPLEVSYVPRAREVRDLVERLAA